jgi:protein phosphatase
LLDPDDILDHPRRNVLTRALGVNAQVEVDTDVLHLAEGDRLALCSDGLWAIMDDTAQFERMLDRVETPEQVVERLIVFANERGGGDNITILVCDIDRNTT